MTKRDREMQEKNGRLLQSVVDGLDPVIGAHIPQLAIKLCRRLTAGQGPDSPILTQLLRSVNSVGANYVEGHAKADIQEVIRYLKMSRGSAYEAIYHAICLDLQDLREDLLVLAESVDNYIISTVESV